MKWRAAVVSLFMYLKECALLIGSCEYGVNRGYGGKTFPPCSGRLPAPPRQGLPAVVGKEERSFLLLVLVVVYFFLSFFGFLLLFFFVSWYIYIHAIFYWFIYVYAYFFSLFIQLSILNLLLLHICLYLWFIHIIFIQWWSAYLTWWVDWDVYVICLGTRAILDNAWFITLL